jgi:hypothetical protein
MRQPVRIPIANGVEAPEVRPVGIAERDKVVKQNEYIFCSFGEGYGGHTTLVEGRCCVRGMAQ